MTLEATLSKRIVVTLNAIPNCHAEKRWTGGMFAHVGEPDITGCIAGRRFEIEVKVPGKRARKVQEKRLEAWASAGAIVGTATSVDEALAIVGVKP